MHSNNVANRHAVISMLDVVAGADLRHVAGLYRGAYRYLSALVIAKSTRENTSPTESNRCSFITAPSKKGIEPCVITSCTSVFAHQPAHSQH